MLQIPAHNTSDMKVLCPARYARKNTADSPYNQIHFHSCLRCLSSFADKIHIRHRVHLHDDAPVLSFRNLLVHQGEHFLFQARGGYNQMIIHPVQIADRHVLKKYRRVLSDLLIGSHQRIICVHLRCLFIVISCSDLSDITDLIFISVCDQTDLRVHLVSLKPINYPASGLFHPLRPVDIILLVKTRPQFNKSGYLLAVLRCGAQVFHKPRLLGQTVDCDLNRHNIRV